MYSLLFGAIAGDMIGAPFEWYSKKTKEFPLFSENSVFTDDSVLTVATADAILTDGDYAAAYRRWGLTYPEAGYGGSFYNWLHSENPQPYQSWGNGSAMRVSPVGFAFHSAERVLAEAKKSAECTHNHPDGIRGAQATALSVFMARSGASKEEIRTRIASDFSYDLSRSLNEIRPAYQFDVSCSGSVPEAILCFLESDSYEDAIRNAVSLGGDADTIAAIAGGIAAAFYKEIPEEIASVLMKKLPSDLLRIVQTFQHFVQQRLPVDLPPL